MSNMIQHIKTQLSTPTTLGYVVDVKNKVIFEKEINEARALARVFGKRFYAQLYCEIFDFDNPYDFINEWTFFDIDGNLVKYDKDFNELITSEVTF